jgi:RNA polymerase sigma factor (sigma-70 family)
MGSIATYTPGNFEGWLHRITLDLFLDQVRRKRRLRMVALPDQVEDRLAGPGPTAADAVDQRDFDLDVRLALESLAPKYLAPVVLRDINGLTYDEIATCLGIQRGTVGSRIHRGRRLLRAALAHRAPSWAQGARPQPTA